MTMMIRLVHNTPRITQRRWYTSGGISPVGSCSSDGGRVHGGLAFWLPLIKLAVLPNVNCDKMHNCRIRLRGWRIVVGVNASITTEQAEAAATAGLRQRKKDSSRRAIEDAAWELFAEQGYEETSINDIAERANVAPRTFFRYFPTKEAVLYPQFEELLQSVRDEFRKRPADEPVITSLFESFEVLAGSLEGEASRARAAHGR